MNLYGYFNFFAQMEGHGGCHTGPKCHPLVIGIWKLEVWNKGDLYFKQLEHAPMYPNAFKVYKIIITSFQRSNEHAAAQNEKKKDQGSHQHLMGSAAGGMVGTTRTQFQQLVT
jgi:hypothetical protein